MNFMTDPSQQPIKTLLLSVTDRCNLRCNYCISSELYNENIQFLALTDLLTFDEIERLIKISTACGVQKVRITGGEPLLRKNIEKLIEKLVCIPNLQDISLVTNGVLLAKYAKKLKKAGLKKINISLDTLDQQTIQFLNGRKIDKSKILEGILLAKGLGFEIKINMLVRKGVNENQIIPMAGFFKTHGITLHFTSFSDLGCSHTWKIENIVPFEHIYELLHKQYPLEPIDSTDTKEITKKYRYVHSNAEVCFIPSIVPVDCPNFTYGRISANGRLYLSLFSNESYPLLPILRNSSTDEQIGQYMTEKWM